MNFEKRLNWQVEEQRIDQWHIIALRTWWEYEQEHLTRQKSILNKLNRNARLADLLYSSANIETDSII